MTLDDKQIEQDWGGPTVTTERLHEIRSDHKRRQDYYDRNAISGDGMHKAIRDLIAYLDALGQEKGATKVFTNDPSNPAHPTYPKYRHYFDRLCAGCDRPIPHEASVERLLRLGWHVKRDGVWRCEPCAHAIQSQPADALGQTGTCDSCKWQETGREYFQPMCGKTATTDGVHVLITKVPCAWLGNGCNAHEPKLGRGPEQQ